MPKKILMIVGDFAEELEVYVPFQVFDMVGHETHAVCPGKKKGEKIILAVHDFAEWQTYTEKTGHQFPLNENFDDINPSNYDALYVPGGRAPEYLRMNETVLKHIRHFIDAKKPIGCICHGVQLLTAAGGIEGRSLSCYPACATELKLAGAKYEDVGFVEAHVDGNLVTGAAWSAHSKLLSKFLEVLGTTF